MTETCKTHDGKVVSVVGDKLTTTCNEGKQHCHTMAKDAKVTCDGKASKAEPPPDISASTRSSSVSPSTAFSTRFAASRPAASGTGCEASTTSMREVGAPCS